MPVIRAALFDLDGTLVDSLPTIAEAMTEAVRLHGLDANPQEIIPLIGAPMNLLVEQIYGVSGEVADQINADYLRIYHGDYIDRTPPNPGAGTLLHGLHRAGMTLGIVTNKNEEGGRRMVAIQRWGDYFQVVAGRDSAAHPKPHPEAALAALRRLDVPREEAAFVGDTEFDMNCGRDAGLAVVIGLVGARSAEHLRDSGATHVIHHLSEVAAIVGGVGAAS
jgi:phosphoglycolate phosphatase